MATGDGWDVGPLSKQDITMMAVPNDPKATLKVFANGKTVSADPSDKTSFTIRLNGGSNHIEVVVVPESGEANKKYYVIKASFELSEDNNTDVSFKFKYGGDEFWPDIENETVNWSVNNSVENLLINAKPRIEGATVVIKKGETEISKTTDGDFKIEGLVEGENKFVATVTAKDKTTTRAIDIIIRRNTSEEDGKDVSLKEVLTLGIGSDLKSVFIPEEFEYYSETKTYEGSPLVRIQGDAKIWIANVSITPANAGQKLEISTNNKVPIGGNPVTEPNNGKYSIYLELNDYENIVMVKVTSADGTANETYIVKVVKDIPTDEGYEAPVWVFLGEPTPENLVPVQFDSNTGEGLLPVKKKPTPENIKLTTKAKYLTDKCKIDGKPTARIDSKDIDLTVTDPKAAITVMMSNGKEYDYTLKFEVAKNDCSLKSLALDKNERFEFQPIVYEYNKVAVPEGNLIVTAIPTIEEAIVTVNDVETDTNNQAKISVDSSTEKITVKVTNGPDSQEYVLNIIPAAKADDKVVAEILVVDSIGGTIVNGTTLKVFEAGTTTQVGNDYTVTNGNVTVTGLDQNKAYDFELVGEVGKHAGSRLENYFIDSKPSREITMYQYKHGQHTREVVPPKIKKISAIPMGSYSGPEVIDGTKLDENIGRIEVQFLSKSGEIYTPDGGGFGAKLAFGSIPTGMSGIYGDNDSFNYKETPEGWEQTFRFNIGNRGAQFPRGKSDLVIVAYDVANNRIERHVFIEYDQNKPSDSLEYAEFKNLFMITRRIPASATIFSKDPNKTIFDVNAFGKLDSDPMALQPVDGKSTSYMAILQFELSDGGKPVPILGFDIYRRRADSGASFEPVARRVYGGLQEGVRSGKTYHLGLDTDSKLEEGVEYEYKLVAFNQNYRKESPVLKGKVLPAFTYELIGPKPYAVLDKAEADAMDYSCKISNPKVLEDADFINFGLLIMDKSGDYVFGAKCIYDFNGKDVDGNLTGKPDLRVTVRGGNQVSVQQLIDKGTFGANVKLSDFIEVNKDGDGVITFKNKFVQTGLFDPLLGEPASYKRATAYQWDILNWGDNPFKLIDDKPMIIGKVLENGTDAIMESVSCGNDMGNSNNALNGRLEFTVK